MRIIRSPEEMAEYIAACVHKRSVTDASRLFIVSCESLKHADLRKFIGYCVAIVGADAFLAFEDGLEKFSDGHPLPADGIFSIYEKKSEIYVGVRYYSGKSEEACLSYPIKRTGSVFTVDESKKRQKSAQINVKM